jgi:hypothetical protein
MVQRDILDLMREELKSIYPFFDETLRDLIQDARIQVKKKESLGLVRLLPMMECRYIDSEPKIYVLIGDEVSGSYKRDIVEQAYGELGDIIAKSLQAANKELERRSCHDGRSNILLVHSNIIIGEMTNFYCVYFDKPTYDQCLTTVQDSAGEGI